MDDVIDGLSRRQIEASQRLVEHQNVVILGQTLGHYGAGPGPYLVLPLFGPSSLRDTAGIVGDYAISWEVNMFGARQAIWASIPLTALEVLDIRDNIAFSYGDLSSPFEYEMVRFLYLESRELEIRE